MGVLLIHRASSRYDSLKSLSSSCRRPRVLISTNFQTGRGFLAPLLIQSRATGRSSRRPWRGEKPCLMAFSPTIVLGSTVDSCNRQASTSDPAVVTTRRSDLSTKQQRSQMQIESFCSRAVTKLLRPRRVDSDNNSCCHLTTPPT